MAVLEKPKRKRRTKAEMEAARTAEKQPTKTKRKRRTKAEMEASKSKDATPPPEKLQPWEIGYPREKITAKPKKTKKVKTYPKQPPRPKFDISLIEDEITMPGGAKYGITIETKHGKHVISHCDINKDWSILYNAKYNDTQKHWKSFVEMYHRILEEKCTPVKGTRRTKKQMEYAKVLKESRKKREG